MAANPPTVGPAPLPELDEGQRLYLDLLKKCLTRFVLGSENYRLFEPRRGTIQSALYRPLRALLRAKGLRVVQPEVFDPAKREVGLDWPAHAETMIGLRRRVNLETVIVDIVRRGVPGDLVEAGVWRGGASIFMRGALKALGERARCVWACDSFAGLPRPDPVRYPADSGDLHWTFAELAVPLEEVRANFARYGLLDQQVRFVTGWFRDSLPRAPIELISLLRIDGDMYESTHVALEALYPKLSPRGYVVVDDYKNIASCRLAVDDFRRRHAITDRIHDIDWTGVYWRRHD